MQITRSARPAAACSSVGRQQRVPSVQVTGWTPRPSADNHVLLHICSYASTSTPNNSHRRQPRSRVVAAAEATEAATDAEIGIHEVEELRGIRANLDSQDPVVEYRVHWKDGSADTWYAWPCGPTACW